MPEFLSALNGSLMGSFVFGFAVGLGYTTFNKISEKI